MKDVMFGQVDDKLKELDAVLRKIQREVGKEVSMIETPGQLWFHNKKNDFLQDKMTKMVNSILATL